MEYEVIKFENGNVELEINVSPEEDTVWLTKDQIATLFNRDRTVISKHINNIYKEGELDKKTSVHFLHISPNTINPKYRPPVYYNLDVVISVGYRVKSNNGILLKRFVDEYLAKNNSLSNNIIIYNNGNVNLAVNVSPNEETVWLTQAEIATLFETTQQNVSYHINNVLEDKELDTSVHKEYLYTAQDGKTYNTSFYNLDMVLAVGYRIKSGRAIEFRKWVTSVLKQYLLKGYAISDNRVTVTEENFNNFKNDVDTLIKRVNRIEEKEKHLLIEDKIIFENQMFDALVIVTRIVETAKETIVLIDPYVDALAIDIFKNKGKDVELIVVTSSKSKLKKHDIEKFNQQYGNLTVLYDDKTHDRYLMLDDEMFYHIGGSINYLGKKLSQITLIEDPDVVEALSKKYESYVLEKMIKEGLDDIEAGRVLSAEEVSKKLEEEFGIK